MGVAHHNADTETDLKWPTAAVVLVGVLTTYTGDTVNRERAHPGTLMLRTPTTCTGQALTQQCQHHLYTSH